MVFVAVLLGLLVAAGCAGTPRQHEPELEAARAGVAELLEGFGEAVAAGSPQQLRPVLLPRMPSSQVGRLAFMLEQASWLELYSGYTVEAESAAARLSWRDSQRGEVRLKVPASNDMGQRLTDEVELVQVRGEWWIRDFELVQPRPEDPVLPPEEVRDSLRPRVQELMESLAAGHIGDIYYAVPEESYRYRRPKQSWWQRLTRPAQPVSLLTDLEIFRRLDFMSWPDPSEPIDYIYLGPGNIAAVYEIPYNWPGKDPSRPEYMDLRFIFTRRPEGWKLLVVRMSGAAFPHS